MSERLERQLVKGRAIRCVGFDDGPFERGSRKRVPVSGIICSDTRFEGMVWGHIRQDGWNATDVLIELLRGGKFLPQLHVVLLDGIALGGFNVVDLPRLSRELDLPCIAVTRKPPNLASVRRALERLTRPQRRWETILRAGELHHVPPFCFQVVGADPEIASATLARLTDTGHVPEALRLAHLIGAAVVTGVSGRRA